MNGVAGLHVDGFILLVSIPSSIPRVANVGSILCGWCLWNDVPLDMHWVSRRPLVLSVWNVESWSLSEGSARNSFFPILFLFFRF